VKTAAWWTLPTAAFVGFIAGAIAEDAASERSDYTGDDLLVLYAGSDGCKDSVYTRTLNGAIEMWLCSDALDQAGDTIVMRGNAIRTDRCEGYANDDECRAHFGLRPVTYESE
jgi:hypothetical protein